MARREQPDQFVADVAACSEDGDQPSDYFLAFILSLVMALFRSVFAF